MREWKTAEGNFKFKTWLKFCNQNVRLYFSMDLILMRKAGVILTSPDSGGNKLKL